MLEEGLDLAGEIIENGAIAEGIDFGVARLGHEPDAGFEAEIFTAVQAEGEELVIETTTIEAIEDFEDSSTLGRDWGEGLGAEPGPSGIAEGEDFFTDGTVDVGIFIPEQSEQSLLLVLGEAFSGGGCGF